MFLVAKLPWQLKLARLAMPIIKEDPLRKYDPDIINFKDVKGEVSEAMHFDWKRDKIDDAKKRAIGTSGSYDEFKDRVAGCTLKPIARGEFNAPASSAFQTRQLQSEKSSKASPFAAHKPDATSQALARHAAGRSESSSAASVFTEKVPKNGHEFDREFRRRATAEDKVRLLELVLENCLVPKLFARELDGEMLRQVLIALEEVLDRSSANKGLPRRFFVTLATECPVSITAACAFFDAEEKGTLARLLARDPGEDPGEDVRICAAFGIPLCRVAEAKAALSPTAEAPVAIVQRTLSEDVGAPVVVAESSGCDDAGYGGMD